MQYKTWKNIFFRLLSLGYFVLTLETARILSGFVRCLLHLFTVKLYLNNVVDLDKSYFKIFPGTDERLGESKAVGRSRGGGYRRKSGHWQGGRH